MTADFSGGRVAGLKVYKLKKLRFCSGFLFPGAKKSGSLVAENSTCGIISLVSTDFAVCPPPPPSSIPEKQRHLHHFITFPRCAVAPGVHPLSCRDEL